MQSAITTLSFDDNLPEDGHCRPKHVGKTSCTCEILRFYCNVVVGISIVFGFTAKNMLPSAVHLPNNTISYLRNLQHEFSSSWKSKSTQRVSSEAGA